MNVSNLMGLYSGRGGGLYSEVYGIRADAPCVYTALLYLHKFLQSISGHFSKPGCQVCFEYS